MNQDTILMMGIAFVIGLLVGFLVALRLFEKGQRAYEARWDASMAELKQGYDEYEAKWNGVIAELKARYDTFTDHWLKELDKLKETS